MGGVLRVLVLSVFGTFPGSSLYCGTGAAVIVVVLFFPPVLGCSLSGLTCVHSMELSALIQ